ncbi:hypothetical protein DCAR_0934629 [Daucus carota subsp. sativus]|uniref:Replication protein A 70 kDa DNA-binding subunit B/D first OB fold domain-containing protein n=1 Tax=Daucus carota subsp. sativus TaxID=79200 RepID=A0A175YG20_DAUCS|nr:hypothetical protein DCAR_0934629 [Daucus carota subsp. sativus]
MEISYLHDLQLHQEEILNLGVAVTRKWAETDSAERVHGMNLIIVDKYVTTTSMADNHMHCWIPSDLVNTLAKKFVEGGHYVITDFPVQPYNQKNHCFDAEIHIVLHNNTIITDMQGSNIDIPKDVFHFTSVKTVDLKPMEPVNGPAYEKHIYLDFYLIDLIDRVPVRFWDHFALQLQKGMTENRRKPSIITISSCKIMKNQYNGENTIRNVKATRMFLNHQSDRDTVLRKRFMKIKKMEFITHSPITKLNSSTIKWTIKARAQAVWKGITRDSKEFRGLNILFVDDSRTRIHGFIAAKLAPMFEKEIMEGEIYQITNFTVQDYTGLEFNRCVRFEKHIFFSHYTKMEICNTDVNVTLFDQLARAFKEAMKNRETGNTVVILSSAKIGKFQGDLNLTNYPSTRFYINPDHPAVKRLLKRSKDKTFLVEKEVKLTQLEKAKVNCKVAVKKIQEHLNWFFYVCTKCNVELDVVDGRYKCTGCSRFFPWPQKRFRLFALCYDKTGVLPLMFADREIRRLTGKMVFDVELHLTEEEEGKFPVLLKNLLNKEYDLTISINEDNISKNNEVYEVCDIQIDLQETAGNMKDVDHMSEDAEDDNDNPVMDAETEGSHNISKEISLPTMHNKEKKVQAAGVSSQKASFKRGKAIKIKKEKNATKQKKTVNEGDDSMLETKKKGRKLIEVISESEDEDMTLNNYKKKTDFNCLSELSAGSFSWKIKVRIVRNWKGVSTSGDGWKGDCRMHAFVPGKVYEEHEAKLKDGNICIISNFTIKEYDTSEKFRFVNHDKQIILTNFSQIEQLDHEDGLIKKNMFDFFDLSQLELISDKNTSLTDVVGIIEKDTPLGDLINRFGKKQKQVKFNIVDGRTSVNVCFWDAMAEEYNQAIEDNSKQYEVANVTATKFYINYEDESVATLGKMYAQGKFSKYDFVNHVKQKNVTLVLADIKKLPIEYAEEIHVVAEDKTGEIDILLLDREIGTIFNLAVIDFDEEVIQNKKVPHIIKALENQKFGIKLLIKDTNVLKQLDTYYATGIYACSSNENRPEGEILTPHSTIPTTVTLGNTEESGPSYHIEDFSDPNIKSPEVDMRPKRKKKLTKKYCD